MVGRNVWDDHLGSPTIYVNVAGSVGRMPNKSTILDDGKERLVNENHPLPRCGGKADLEIGYMPNGSTILDDGKQ